MPDWGGSMLIYAMTSSAFLADPVEPWRQLERDRIAARVAPAPEVRGVDVTAQRAAPDYGAGGAVTPIPHAFPAVEVT